MKERWILAIAIALIGVAASVANVLATPATVPGFSGSTLAKATFGEIFSHVQSHDPQFWNEVIKTEGSSDLYVQQNTWDPGACGGCVPSTGWHTHPGPSFVTVTQGTLTVYDGDDPTCTPHVYSATGPTKAFIDIGGGAVHVIRNESGAVAKTIAVQLIAQGAVRRQDAPDPGSCPF
jgi:hypothetical protein